MWASTPSSSAATTPTSSTAREPGFFFYRCHRYTPLHFEMGLYGALFVNPAEGPGFVPADNPTTSHLVRHDAEVIWVCGAHDHRWRDYSHGHGLHVASLLGELGPNDPAASPDEGGTLGDWRPGVFTISGAVARSATSVITEARAMGRAKVGQTVLIRLLNASYAIQEYRLGVDALIIAQDGRSCGVRPSAATRSASGSKPARPSISPRRCAATSRRRRTRRRWGNAPIDALPHTPIGVWGASTAPGHPRVTGRRVVKMVAKPRPPTRSRAWWQRARTPSRRPDRRHPDAERRSSARLAAPDPLGRGARDRVARRP